MEASIRALSSELGIALSDVNNWRYKAEVVGVPGSDAGADADAGAIEKVAAASMGMGGGCVIDRPSYQELWMLRIRWVERRQCDGKSQLPAGCDLLNLELAPSQTKNSGEINRC